MNSTFLLVFVNILAHGSELRLKIWTDKGLSNDAWTIIIGNIILPSLSSILNPFYFLRLWKRRGIKNSPETCNLTQKEANYYFEGHPFDIAQKYGNMLTFTMVGFFFMPILPLSPGLSIFAVLSLYITEKILLYKRYAAPEATGAKLNFGMYRFFDFVLIVYGISQLTFDIILRLDVSAYSIAILTIAGLHYLFGFHYLYKKIFKFRNSESTEILTPYSKNRTQFYAEYDRCNPITQARASEDYLNFLKKQKPEFADQINKILNKLGVDEKEDDGKSKGNTKTDPFTDFFNAVDNGINMYANQNMALEQRVSPGLFNLGPSPSIYQGGNMASLLISPHKTKNDASMILNGLLLNQNRINHMTSAPPPFNPMMSSMRQGGPNFIPMMSKSYMGPGNGNINPLLAVLTNIANAPQRNFMNFPPPPMNNPNPYMNRQGGFGPPPPPIPSPMQVPSFNMPNDPMRNRKMGLGQYRRRMTNGMDNGGGRQPPSPFLRSDTMPLNLPPMMNNTPLVRNRGNPTPPPMLPPQNGDQSFSNFLSDVVNQPPSNSFYAPGGGAMNNSGMFERDNSFTNPIPPPRLPPNRRTGPPTGPDNALLKMLARGNTQNNGSGFPPMNPNNDPTSFYAPGFM